MTHRATFAIGSDVTCSDGEVGQLRRVVVDPVARAVTHLVVEPKHRTGSGRLVPIDLAESVDQQIRLQCTTAEFDALEGADETRFLQTTSGVWGYNSGDLLALPYYSLGVEGTVMGGGGLSTRPLVAVTDRVPAGDVEVRRGEPVHATDGAIGRVQGLVIDPRDHHVTHVLLDEGHLWGKKRVAIPITAVAGVDDGVRLNLTKDDVRDLPEIDVVDPQ
jgi:sporulation protein YlmC with PRC-barrel domain